MAAFNTASMRDFAVLVFLMAGYHSELLVQFADCCSYTICLSILNAFSVFQKTFFFLIEISV